jgi:hypothetical protein
MSAAIRESKGRIILRTRAIPSRISIGRGALGLATGPKVRQSKRVVNFDPTLVSVLARAIAVITERSPTHNALVASISTFLEELDFDADS